MQAIVDPEGTCAACSSRHVVGARAMLRPRLWSAAVATPGYENNSSYFRVFRVELSDLNTPGPETALLSSARRATGNKAFHGSIYDFRSIVLDASTSIEEVQHVS